MATLPVESPNPNALQGLGRLAPWRQGLLLVAVAATIAVGIATAMWLQRPAFTPLRGRLSTIDLAEAGATLRRADIPYEVGEGGLVLVPSERQQDAELALAQAGLAPAAGLGLDEVLAKDPGLGTSRLMQRSRLERAREVELGRTIASMKPVAAARVHLALPRGSAFARSRQPPSAAVFLELHPGRRLDETQVDTIRQLVAQAVANLAPESVAITDSSGRLLGRAGHGEGAEQQRQLEYTRRLEGLRYQKIVRLLTPIAGPGGFTAEVSAEVDFTRSEVAKKSWNPDLTAVRSRTTTEEEDGAPRPGGVPGALSNQPPAAASAPEEAAARSGGPPDGAGPAGPRRRRRSETVNNEVDSEISHVLQASPRITHLSVAVVLDDLRFAGPDGTPERRPWTPEQLNRIETQVKSAIGFNAERGDVVSVTNTRFAPPVEIEPLPEPPIWEQPWVWDIARQVGAGLLALLVVFGVLKPIMRSLVNRDRAEAEVQQSAEQARLAAEAESRRAEMPALPDETAHAASINEFERNLDAVRELVNEDPRRAANVVKEWVTEHG